MPVDVLLLEDDTPYAQVVQDYFRDHQETYSLRLHHARDIATALLICRQFDVRVSVVDVSLPNGTLGTDAISEIWKFDKKIVFIIHTVHNPQAIAEWTAQAGVPYTSQLFLKKLGAGQSSFANDAAALHALATKALRSYVPHIPPTLLSVRDVIEVIDNFADVRSSFRRGAIVRNIHHSQDVLNSASQWAADKLARVGFDSTRIAVAMTGSFARLEATPSSDADYFVVFDDRGLSARHIAELIDVTYAAFLEVGAWFERNSVEAHGYDAENKRPANIAWHTTVLPTWFPQSSFMAARLGRSTQIEITKQWILLESFPLFNGQLLKQIRNEVASQFGILSHSTIREALMYSSFPESYQLLREEFDFAFRHRERDSLRIIKHYFMRVLNLFSIRLWLLRSFLDPKIFDSSPDTLIETLLPHPLARILQFHKFLQNAGLLNSKALARCLSSLESIAHLYAEAAYSFGSDELRLPDQSHETTALKNDLADAGKICDEHVSQILQVLKSSRSISTHSAISSRRLLD